MKKFFWKILAGITAIFSGFMIFGAIIDFLSSKDSIDCVIFLFFIGPYIISLRYLIKNVNISSQMAPSSLEQRIHLPETIAESPIQNLTNVKNLPIPSGNHNSDTTKVIFPDWHISISFGNSSSENYLKAVTLAKSAPYYHEQVDFGNILHQATYSSSPKDFLKFVMLYELVGSWKSSFVMVCGKLVDRKIVGKLNYCYGDKCRSGDQEFCYGASYMTENPFGCHRIQISACNNPWWSFYRKRGSKWVLNKQKMKDRIDSYSQIFCVCPDFDYQNIMKELDKLPSVLSESQLQRLQQNHFGLRL